MKRICFYFQVHQPYRLRNYRFFDIGKDHYYLDDVTNREIAHKVANKSYLPMNQVLLDLIKEHGAAFKVTFSISGVALEQFEQYTPDVIESFKHLAATGNVEFLSETYAHSLAALKSEKEFKRQVKLHAKKIKELFGLKPKIFRNTELVYSNKISELVADMGYKAMLTEGARHVLTWRSPNMLYASAVRPELKLLLKNYKLSDDIAFRFSNRGWEEWPLTTDKFVHWITQLPEHDEVVNLFMDYETFGEHQWEETGIFKFMHHLPTELFKQGDYQFSTCTEVAKTLQPVAQLNVEHPISWADEERDLTAWLGNELQDEAFDKCYDLEEKVLACKNPEILDTWMKLQTSDHFYYMCTKWFSDGDVHKYFNPYSSPYKAFVNYMNVLSDFMLYVDQFTTMK